MLTLQSTSLLYISQNYSGSIIPAVCEDWGRPGAAVVLRRGGSGADVRRPRRGQSRHCVVACGWPAAACPGTHPLASPSPLTAACPSCEHSTTPLAACQTELATLFGGCGLGLLKQVSVMCFKCFVTTTGFYIMALWETRTKLADTLCTDLSIHIFVMHISPKMEDY